MSSPWEVSNLLKKPCSKGTCLHILLELVLLLNKCLAWLLKFMLVKLLPHEGVVASETISEHKSLKRSYSAVTKTSLVLMLASFTIKSIQANCLDCKDRPTFSFGSSSSAASPGQPRAA